MPRKPGLVFVAGLLLLGSGCGWLLTDARATMAEAAGDWVLVGGTIDGARLSIPAEAEATLAVAPGRFGGHSGCNGFGADVTESDGTVAVGSILQTLIGCSNEINRFESAYLAALARVTGLLRRGSDLTLIGPGVELRFSAALGG